MLSGDNGILQKAKDAKTFSERESVVEQARTDVLGYQTENQGGDLDKSQLKSVLDKYFDEVPDLTDMEKDAILNRELHTLSKYGTHTIAVYEIYNGDFLNTKSNKKLVELIKSTDYGKSIDYSVTVNGTTLNNWKVFLNDGNNVYIILSNCLTGSLLPNFGFPVEINNNAYTLMYECDGNPEDITDKLANTNYFSDFASGEGAVSATGGPSKEQLDASYESEVHIGDNLDGSLYTIGNNWLLAETSYYEKYGAYIVFYDGQLDAVANDGAGGPIRPLVKLSSEATGTVGTTIEIDK